MNSFRGKYNYLVLFLMVIGVIVFLTIFLLLAINARVFYEASSDKGDKVIRCFGFLLIGLSSAFFVYSLILGLRRRRFNLYIKEDELILKNIFSGTENHIEIEKVKGFSTSDIHSKMSHFHIVTVYAGNNRTYEFPHFMLRNFKELKKAFRMVGIEYLGHETYSLKWYGTRRYKYF